jgi:uncharacterized protein YecT (DUF1311 family)
MRTLIVSALLLLPLLALAANESGTEAKRKTCLHRASTTKEMKQCEYDAFREASAELTQLQAQILEGLKRSDMDSTKEIQKRFIASNQAWVTLRDSHCRFKSAEMLNGSEESLLLASCTVNMTLDRIKDLTSTRI